MNAQLEEYLARQERAARGVETRKANAAKKAERLAKRRVKANLPPERAPATAPKKKRSKHQDKKTAAKQGHAKRRATAPARVRYFVNAEDEGKGPGDRLTGETPVTLYTALHPTHPTSVADMNRWRGLVAPFHGHTIKLVANGERRSDAVATLGKKISRVYIARVGAVNSYEDVFGNDGLYYKVMKAIFEANSDGFIVITSLTFEVADSDATESEFFGEDAPDESGDDDA